MQFPKVLKKDNGIRPAGPKDACFYCRSKVGEEHKPSCVMVVKKIKLKAEIIYEVEVPFDWDEDEIDFHRNESSWCADNMIHELEEIKKKSCLCPNTEFSFIEVVEKGPLRS